MTMQAVGIDSRVFQKSHEDPLFEALVDARARTNRSVDTVSQMVQTKGLKIEPFQDPEKDIPGLISKFLHGEKNGR